MISKVNKNTQLSKASKTEANTKLMRLSSLRTIRADATAELSTNSAEGVCADEPYSTAKNSKNEKYTATRSLNSIAVSITTNEAGKIMGKVKGVEKTGNFLPNTATAYTSTNIIASVTASFNSSCRLRKKDENSKNISTLKSIKNSIALPTALKSTYAGVSAIFFNLS